MRIGIDARMLGFAPGIGRYIAELTRELFLLDQENEYVMFLREPTYSLYSAREFQRGSALGKVPQGSARIWKMRAPERWYGLLEQITLPFRFKNADLDLLFVPQFNVSFWTPCPFFVTIHDVTQLYMPGPLQERSTFRRRAFRAVFRHAVKRARAVIAVSEYTKGEIVKNFNIDPKKIRVIYEGPGLSLTAKETLNSKSETLNKPKIQNPNDQNGLELRTSNLELPHGEYVLAVGVWRPHKNFVGLLDSFAALKRSEPAFSDLKLVLVGQEDPRYPEVRERIHSLGLGADVVLDGQADDERLAQWYRGARAVVVPSFYEGFGFVGIEALRYGVPVLSSNNAALPEILGNAALYCDPNSVEDMTKGLRRILNDAHERERILKAAPAVLARYSWKEAAAKTLTLIREAAMSS